jgi:lipid A 3-O-deacylase
MKAPLTVSMAVLLAAFPAAAQDSANTNAPAPEDTRTVEQQVPQSVTNSLQDNVITVNIENDLFTGEDSNYTSGVRLTYLDISSDFPEFAKDLADFVPSFDINDTSSLFYSLGQNIFTPKDITASVQDPDDRPWAAFLYGSMGMVTFTDNHTDEIEATLGVVGPAALGEEAQKFIHKNLSNSPEPMGWDNQLHNEPAVMLGWQRTWPQYMSGDVMGLFGSIAPYTGVTVGNVYTYGDVGVNFRLGPDSEKWQDTPTRVRPAMPGTGFFEIPEDDWSWYLFAGAEGRVVGRDIFLDGNTFEDSHSVDKNYLVGDANAGLALTYGKMRVSFTWVYRTKEFKTQDDPETFGSVSIGYRF